MNIFSLVQTALELGLICSLTVLALFLSYSMLNVCDLSTDGCFTLGAAVGAMVAIAGTRSGPGLLSGRPGRAEYSGRHGRRSPLRLHHRPAANENGH